MLKPSVISICLSCVLVFVGAAHASEYRIGLCLFGCPVGANPASDIILRPIYAMAYNTEFKSAEWVVYKVSADSIGIASSLSRTLIQDNFISNTLQAEDFVDMQDTTLVQSRYVPVVNFAGTPFWQDTNYTTNSIARSSALNQGAWYGLEWAIRNLVNREEAVFVVTGPVFKADSNMPQLHTSRAHRVPDAFFKIVITGSGRASAFLMDQGAPVHLHHCAMRTSIAELEALTALDFFPEAGSRQFGSLDTALGCLD